MKIRRPDVSAAIVILSMIMTDICCALNKNRPDAFENEMTLKQPIELIDHRLFITC